MKFQRRPKYGPFNDTPRKRAAALRNQKRERERFPLFAGAIGLAQPSIDDLMDRRAFQWDRQEQEDQNRRARSWRTIRADIAALPLRQRLTIRKMAQRYGGPLNPGAYAFFYREVTGFHHPGAPCGMGGKPAPARAPPQA